MEIVKVKVWKANKPQFEVLDYMNKAIYSVRRINDNKRFHQFLAVHLKGNRISSTNMNLIAGFEEDYKSVKIYSYINHKCTGQANVEINNIEAATTEEAQTYFNNPINSFSSKARI